MPQVCKILQSKSPGDTIRVSGIGLTSPENYTPDYSQASFTEDIKLPDEAVATSSTTSAASTSSTTSSTTSTTSTP